MACAEAVSQRQAAVGLGGWSWPSLVLRLPGPVSHMSHGLMGRSRSEGPDLDSLDDADLRRRTMRTTQDDPLPTTDQKVGSSNLSGRTSSITAIWALTCGFVCIPRRSVSCGAMLISIGCPMGARTIADQSIRDGYLAPHWTGRRDWLCLLEMHVHSACWVYFGASVVSCAAVAV
jgi:hypothetical protein